MNYDVFLSCKSEDYKIAEEVYQYLTDNGFHVFLSSKELRRMKDSEYIDAISDALDSAYHLIVLSSSASNIKSKWVKFEWTTFLNEVLSERKKGQIMTLVNNISVAELPIQLRHYEMFHLDDYKERILSYIETPDYIQRRLEAEERKKREAALNKLINELLCKIPTVEVKQPNQEPNTTSLTNKEGFDVGYDLTVFTIHKLRGQTSEKDEALIVQRLTELGVCPKTLLGNLDAGTMIQNLSNCALRLGELHGKDMENCVCLGSLFVLSVIAKRSNISEKFGHSYDEGIVVACQHLRIPNSFIEKLIKSSDDEMEEMLDELKVLLSTK